MVDSECETFLRARYGDRVHDIEPLHGGAWSSAYGFVLDDEPLVIRFGSWVEDFEKDRLMAELSTELPELPVPEVLDLGTTGDRCFAISRRAYGSFLDELSDPQMSAALPSLLETLREIRSVEPPGDGYGGWDGQGLAPHSCWADALLEVAVDEPGGRVSGWRGRLADSELGIEPFDSGLRALESLTAQLPADVPRRLIHSDLLHRNVLVRDGAVSAVFDWANAMYGDPLFDLAWLTYWWPWHPQWHRIDIRKAIEPDLASLGPADQVERRLLCCQIRIGLEHMAYNAFTGDWVEVERNTQQTLELIRAL